MIIGKERTVAGRDRRRSPRSPITISMEYYMEVSSKKLTGGGRRI